MYCFAPAIGTAHGLYKAAPELRLSGSPRWSSFTRSRWCCTAAPVERAAVQRPDLPRLRQGQHLHRAEDRVRRCPPGIPDRESRQARSPVNAQPCQAGRQGHGRVSHRPAFNETFAELGLPVHWSEAEYGVKLRIGGGKERMGSLLTDEFVTANHLPLDAEGQRALLADWHRGRQPGHAQIRPGVQPDHAGRRPARRQGVDRPGIRLRS